MHLYQSKDFGSQEDFEALTDLACYIARVRDSFILFNQNGLDLLELHPKTPAVQPMAAHLSEQIIKAQASFESPAATRVHDAMPIADDHITAFPLIAESGIMGYLCLQDNTPFKLTDDQVTALRKLVLQLCQT
ncbi:MAG TPA: hypothetical protein VGD90_08305, partial [Sphingobacteriaceae bacterium]